MIFTTQLLNILGILFLFLCFALVFFTIIVILSLPKRLPFNPIGKHALITGGSKGIGKCIAAELLRVGCRDITIVARNLDDLKTTQEQLTQLCVTGQSVHVYSIDLTANSKEIKSLIDTIVDNIGPVDLLVNNVGTVIQGAFDELDEQAFEHQMRTNFFSAVFMTRAMLPYMKNKCNGHIAFVSSAAGQCAIWGYSAYSSSKFALRAFADVLQMELRPYGIGISVLFPPNTATEGFEIEKRTMPEQIRAISNSAGIYPPEHVAHAFVRSILRGEFWTCIGIEGQLLGLLSACSSPEPNPLKVLVQIFLSGITRGIMLIYNASFDVIIQKHYKKDHFKQ